MSIELASLTNSPVIGVSHTGHFFHDDHDNNIKRAWNHRHNVIEQIEHKLDFLEKHLFADPDLSSLGYTPCNTDLVLIGHSIGCFIILEMLESMRNDLKKQVKKAILLFPTIERMSATPNGKLVTFSLTFFMWLVYMLAFLCTLLPTFVHTWGVELLLLRQKRGVRTTKKNKKNGECMGGVVDNASSVVRNMCASYSCMRSCLFMGRDEMRHVKELNTRLVERNLHLLLFYYGAADKWCPLDYYYDMQTYVNTLHNANTKTPTLILDSHGMDHAFCLFKDQSAAISRMVNEWSK